MTSTFFGGVPEYIIHAMKSVRDPVDILWNSLLVAELVNNHPELAISSADNGFDIAIYTEDFNRFLIRKQDGYFSMSIPFQVLFDSDGLISFNCDMIQEPVNGRFISIMRNAINTVSGGGISHESVLLSFYENFNMDVGEAALYYDAFTTMLSEDHGYFRFDDDPNNASGHVHPRYHFDIFYKNSSSLKIGYHKNAQVRCFLSLADRNAVKMYLTDPPL